jgi:ATP-dependent DNA helicase PIF1
MKKKTNLISWLNASTPNENTKRKLQMTPSESGSGKKQRVLPLHTPLSTPSSTTVTHSEEGSRNPSSNIEFRSAASTSSLVFGEPQTPKPSSASFSRSRPSAGAASLDVHRYTPLMEEDLSQVVLSEDQKLVVTHVMNGESIFFTGAAGSGKSFVLKHVVKLLQQKIGSEHIFVTASTGIAASNIGAITMHSFSGTGFGDSLTVDQAIKSVSRVRSATLSPPIYNQYPDTLQAISDLFSTPPLVLHVE